MKNLERNEKYIASGFESSDDEEDGFGSKKTTIKLVNDDLKVKVGGGFLSIDEFIA